ncbi:mucin-17 [Prunus yedoensis var. nudiflora]|uniref:Mucin-17 n=1 Tax=Prunus yedoensis var. nudiflora TaxID=2094558 RepID=A0A314UPM5_PRUYE|nr:mucin-17 [Prunus yedoensis var. nudiflora]
MKGTSKVIMGATLVMVVSLAIVLGLILVLLAELYCSLLLRRRQLKTNTSNPNPNLNATATADAVDSAATTTSSQQPSSQPQDHSAGPPLSSFLGVLRAPRSFLFPSVPCKQDNAETKKHHSHLLHQVFDIPVPSQEILRNTTPCHIGVIISSPSPSISFVTSPQPTQEEKIQAASTRHSGGENNTPFETPETSPSRLEMGGGSSSSSGEDEVAQPTPSGPSSPTTTPPLTPMKKLPAEACSVPLRDARSLGTSGSDSNTNNGLSSSSSGSPCTSPSW